MSNLAIKPTHRLKVAHKAPQQTNNGLLALLISANLDKSRIVIADHELSEHFLTLYLEDKQDFKSDIADTLMYKMPVSQFSEVIAKEGLNTYPGTKYSNDGRPYEAAIEIAPPIQWYNEDATLYQQENTLEMVLGHILKSLSK